MNQTGHRSVLMVRRYIRDGGLFRENSAAKPGLWTRLRAESTRQSLQGFALVNRNSISIYCENRLLTLLQ